jgi:chromosome segregation ATPase
VQAWFARELERELAALRVEVALVRVENERVRSDIDRIRAEVEQRTAEVAKANAERDEARRKWCELASAFSASIITAEGLAKERGWDCFDAKEGEP